MPVDKCCILVEKDMIGWYIPLGMNIYSKGLATYSWLTLYYLHVRLLLGVGNQMFILLIALTLTKKT